MGEELHRGTTVVVEPGEVVNAEHDSMPDLRESWSGVFHSNREGWSVCTALSVL